MSVSLAAAPGWAFYSPIGHGGDGLLSEAAKQLPRELVLAKLRPLLEDEATLKIGHNLKYDLIVLRRAGVDVAPYDDTMLLSYALDAGRNGHGGVAGDIGVEHVLDQGLHQGGHARHRMHRADRKSTRLNSSH